jgi:hypothetical protein
MVLRSLVGQRQGFGGQVAKIILPNPPGFGWFAGGASFC